MNVNTFSRFKAEQRPVGRCRSNGCGRPFELWGRACAPQWAAKQKTLWDEIGG